MRLLYGRVTEPRTEYTPLFFSPATGTIAQFRGLCGVALGVVGRRHRDFHLKNLAGDRKVLCKRREPDLLPELIDVARVLQRHYKGFAISDSPDLSAKALLPAEIELDGVVDDRKRLGVISCFLEIPLDERKSRKQQAQVASMFRKNHCRIGGLGPEASSVDPAYLLHERPEMADVLGNNAVNLLLLERLALDRFLVFPQPVGDPPERRPWPVSESLRKRPRLAARQVSWLYTPSRLTRSGTEPVPPKVRAPSASPPSCAVSHRNRPSR